MFASQSLIHPRFKAMVILVGCLAYVCGGTAHAQDCPYDVARAERAWNGRLADFVGKFPVTATALLACAAKAADEPTPEGKTTAFLACALLPCISVGFGTCRDAGIEALQLAVERSRIENALGVCKPN